MARALQGRLRLLGEMLSTDMTSAVLSLANMPDIGQFRDLAWV